MHRALLAGSAYFLVVFALGFLLGTIRTTIAAPRAGPLLATLLEVPLMLAFAALACRWAVRRWQIAPRLALRSAMSATFLLLMLCFETGLGALLFGRALADQAAALATPAGFLGLAAQLVAALLPLWVERRGAPLDPGLPMGHRDLTGSKREQARARAGG